jgi:Ca2+:H+ antiporter
VAQPGPDTDGDNDSLRSRASQRSPLAKYLIYTGSALRATLFCSYANLFLIFVPLGIVAGRHEWASVAVFTLNFLAIFPLAALLSYSTDELSAKVGLIVGGLINASFGNAVEMIVSYSCACIVFCCAMGWKWHGWLMEHV